MTDSVVIEGLVIPARWDTDGRVNAVMISTFDEKEYRVEPSPKGHELLNLLQKKVTAKGRVGKDARGDLYIEIIDYTLIDIPTVRRVRGEGDGSVTGGKSVS